MNNFWKKLNKPISALAPMAGITDSAFRQICKSFGADVVYSEMASVTALSYSPKKTLKMLEFSKIEKPYIVQLFGNNSKHFSEAVKIIEKEIKPDGIDINFGCPAKKVVKQGAGAELMKDLKLSKNIIQSVINNTNIPISIKTRTKVGDVDILRFLDYIQDLDLKAIMIHGRTLSQGFSGEINTEIIKKARNYFNGIILANGGINNCDDALKIINESNADGIGIARGALGNPWIFSDVKENKNKIKNYKNIFKIIIQHAEIIEKLKGKQGIIEMRKHLCWYIHSFANASKIRQKLVKVENVNDIIKIFDLYFIE